MLREVLFDPIGVTSLSLGFDFWDVKLTNQIATLSENLVFENPTVYDSLLRSYFDPIQKQDVLVAALTPFNLSTAHYQGIDWDHTYRTGTALGKVALQWTGTFMTKAEQDNPGTGLEKNIGRFNSYADVTFRVISKLTASLVRSSQKPPIGVCKSRIRRRSCWPSGCILTG